MNVRDRFMKVLKDAMEADATNIDASVGDEQLWQAEQVLTPTVVEELVDLMDLLGAIAFGANQLCANALAGGVPAGEFANLFHMSGVALSSSPQALEDRKKIIAMMRETRDQFVAESKQTTKH